MTKREEWLALAERCEKATGPDREIDFDIDVARHAPKRIRGFQALAPYTASIDAITALIERKLPRWSWSASLSETRKFAQADLGRSYPTNRRVTTEHKTPALALCAAFCRAKAEVSHDQ